MVKKLLVGIFFLSVCSTANAAYWIKYDSVTTYDPKCVIGDGVKVGAVASYDTYDQPLTGWLASDIDECDDAMAGGNIKVDTNSVSGSRIVPMLQSEIDAVAAAEAQAVIDRKVASDSALDDRISSAKEADADLTKVDTAIDNIGNLDDAKAFLKKLARYIATLD